MNKAIIQGNLTRDPELKALPSGTKVANFSVATNHVWYNEAKEKQEKVTFHNVVVFGKQAETVAQYFSKGMKILLEGRLDTQTWDDKDSGKKMYRTEIIMDKFHFCGSKGDGNTQNREEQAQSTIQYPDESKKPSLDDEFNEDQDINPEDIPF
ncbi:MAG: single-stranded DNA-binding protein [Candidatus Peribacteraceae bacterium]|nr:single-stranded DNA-binding protein [Candidatus Peribacteraceae bacterium]